MKTSKDTAKPQGYQTPVGRFRRFPQTGQRDPVTGLSLSTLIKWRNQGKIKAAVIKDPDSKKGVTLLDGESLEAFLISQIVGPEVKAGDNTAAVARIKELSARKRKGRFPTANPKKKEATDETPTT